MVYSDAGIVNNPYQGKYRRVLCICTMGLLRSPTAALVLSQEPYSYNTRSCGYDPLALVPLSSTLLDWADEIVVMDDATETKVVSMTDKPVKNLNISDNYEYRDKGLMELIRRRYGS